MILLMTIFGEKGIGLLVLCDVAEASLFSEDLAAAGRRKCEKSKRKLTAVMRCSPLKVGAHCPAWSEKNNARQTHDEVLW